MFGASGAVLNVSKLPCRALEAVAGRSDRHLFWAGTAVAGKADNELVLTEFKEEFNSAKRIASAPLPGEAWSLAAHPTKPELVLACLGATDVSAPAARTGSILRVSDGTFDLDPDSSHVAELDVVGTLNMGKNSKVLRRVLWHPADEDFDTGNAHDESRLASVSDGVVHLWDLLGSRLDNIGEAQLAEGQANCAAWDPHHVTEISAGAGTRIQTVDLRSMQVVRTIEDAHDLAVRDVDYNPNKPYYCVTAGDDRRCKFWDLRKSNTPVKVITAHAHWVCNVKYNRFHDQLVLTSGTDSLANLYRMSSISSAPLLELEEDLGEPASANSASSSRDGNPASDSADAVVKSIDSHADSVYGAAWSACDAWVFATLSYDGSLAINHVPSAEKYKILL